MEGGVRSDQGMSRTPPVHPKTYPVVEVFGPTIQGEGALAGLPTMFVRFGLCDYRCSWCDSKFAVEPSLVKLHATRMTAIEVFEVVLKQAGTCEWVTLSGGNPAVHDLSELVDGFQAAGSFNVAVETQGSIWRTWLASVDQLVVSPKPPSSGEAGEDNEAQHDEFMERAVDVPWVNRSLKIVVFDDDDLDWAREQIGRRKREWATYLSVGTNPTQAWGRQWTEKVSTRQVRDEVGERYRWLCERVASDPVFAATRILPQLHVISWGHARGV